MKRGDRHFLPTQALLKNLNSPLDQLAGINFKTADLTAKSKKGVASRFSFE